MICSSASRPRPTVYQIPSYMAQWRLLARRAGDPVGRYSRSTFPERGRPVDARADGGRMGRAQQFERDTRTLPGSRPRLTNWWLASCALRWQLRVRTQHTSCIRQRDSRKGAGPNCIETGQIIDVPLHRSQRIFYRRNVDAAKITLPWAKQLAAAALGRQGSRKSGRPQRP
jgi:hypothetical protein